MLFEHGGTLTSLFGGVTNVELQIATCVARIEDACLNGQIFVDILEECI